MDATAIVRIKDVPNILGISLSTVRRLIDAGRLTPLKLSTRARGFTRSQLDDYINEMKDSK